jgi:hypothetical protein
VSAETRSGHSSQAAQLGALNAAHASQTALAHAAPNSRVGLIASYRNSLLAYEQALASNNTVQASNALAAAAQSLAKASNKSITTSSVAALNNQLGIQTSTATNAVIASQAAALKGTR